MTEIRVEERGTGRTTSLIRWAAEEQPPPAPLRFIVCASYKECRRVAAEAEKMGLHIRFPVTWEGMMRMGGHYRPVEFAIDNLSQILSNMAGANVVRTVVW